MVNYVGYPPQLFLATEHKKWCEDHDIPFMLLEWGGGDRFGNVAAYTDKEREFYNANVTHDRRVNAKETPKASHVITMQDTASLKASRNEVLKIEGVILNKSDFDWLENAHIGVKIGARLYPAQGNGEGWKALLDRRSQQPLKELRQGLPAGKVLRGDTAPFRFEVDCSKLEAGRYELMIDAVDEGKFWLGQIGAMPKRVVFQVT